MRNPLQTLLNWARDKKKHLVLFLLFFLVSTISFGLGYLIRGEESRVPIIIEKHSP